MWFLAAPQTSSVHSCLHSTPSLTAFATRRMTCGRNPRHGRAGALRSKAIPSPPCRTASNPLLDVWRIPSQEATWELAAYQRGGARPLSRTGGAADAGGRPPCDAGMRGCIPRDTISSSRQGPRDASGRVFMHTGCPAMLACARVRQGAGTHLCTRVHAPFCRCSGKSPQGTVSRIGVRTGTSHAGGLE